MASRFAAGSPRLFFGHPEAQKDSNLVSYFVPTAVAEAVADPKEAPAILAGPKGCGKTALFKLLTPPTDVLAVRINPETHQLPETKSRLSAAHLRRLLTLELLIEGLRAAKPSLNQGTNGKALAKDVSTAVDGYYGAIGKALGFAKRIGRGALEEGWQAPFGITLKVAPEERDEILASASGSKSLAVRECYRRLGHAGIKILVLVDDPDELSGTTEKIVPQLGGLCSAALDASALPETQGTLRVCVFVKQHHLDVLERHFENYDHIWSNIVPLSWSEDELGDLLAARIRFKKGLDPSVDRDAAWMECFEGGSQAVLAARRYVLDRLASGPRDLLVYCNLAMAHAAARGAERITSDDLRAAEAPYSADRLKEVEREYGDQFPSVSEVALQLFAHHSLRSASAVPRATLEAAIDERTTEDDIEALRKETRWFREASAKTIASILFRVGILGYISPRTGQRILNWSGDSTEGGVDSATDFFVLPAYHHVLGISDAVRNRRPAKKNRRS